MKGLFLLTLCAICCLNQVTSSALTKEINLAQKAELQSSQQALKNAIEALSDANVRVEVANLILKSPEALVTNLADLLNRNSNPEVADVLDVFNVALGIKLLVINEDYIQVDVAALERLLTQNAKSLARVLYPKDYFQQLITFRVFQAKIKEIGQIVSPIVDDRKVPVQSFAALLASRELAVSSRIQKKDLITDIIVNIETSLCNTVVAAAYNQVNLTLNSYLEFLNNIQIAPVDNVVLNLVVVAINLAVDLAKNAIEAVNKLAVALSESVCSNLFASNSTNSTASRRRRDLTSEYFLEDAALTRGAESGLVTRDLFSGLWALVWGIVSPLLNATLSTWASNTVNSLQGQIDSFLQKEVLNYIKALISSIFPA